MSHPAHPQADPGNRLIAENKKARFNYEIRETLECGIELKGSEVKSVKLGRLSFPDSFCLLQHNEWWIQGMQITPYEFGSLFTPDPNRKKKLLMHKTESEKLKRQTETKGLSVVPLKFYLKKGRVKVLIGIGKGKKLHDKRAAIKERDLDRTAARELGKP